jgi:hypothetical protein
MIGDSGGMGGGGGDDDSIGPKLPLSFGGYGYGGGGINVADFGGDYTRGLISAGFAPGNFGLPGTSADYQSGGKFSSEGIASLTPGGFETTGETGTLNDVDAVFATAKAVDPIASMLRNYGSDISFTPDVQTPDMSSFVAPGDQPQGSFLGNVGKSVTSFLGRLAKIHPATRNATFALGFIKGLQDAKDPKSFVTNVVKQLGASKIGSNLGLSGLQKQGVGSLINMARGKQDLGQTIRGLGTSAAFRKAAPSIFKSAYAQGGMNGVYAAAAALSMAQKAAMRRAMQPGPPGDG